MSETRVNVSIPVTLDSSGQATVSFTDGGLVAGIVISTLATALPVASEISSGGTVIDYCLDGSWKTTGQPISLLGAALSVSYDGGPNAAGVTGTLVIGVSPV